MKKTEILEMIHTVEIDDAIVRRIETKYQCVLNDDLKRLISLSRDGAFLDGSAFCRLLSFDEIENAEKQLHVKFGEIGLMPIFDSGDNDFIVFNYRDGTWSMFNIVDEVQFKQRQSLAEILPQ